MENGYPICFFLSTERITLTENDEIINKDSETVNKINNFFSNIITNLSAPEYHDCEDIPRNISDPDLKAFVIYRNHPSIKAIKRVSNLNDVFSFDVGDKEKILKEISSLDHAKAYQGSDIPTKIIKEILTFFQNFFIFHLMPQSIKEPFHQFSNWLMLSQFLKKVFRTIKIITDQSAF